MNLLLRWYYRKRGIWRTPTGQILRPADFERLADEAERGYDIEHLIKKEKRHE